MWAAVAVGVSMGVGGILAALAWHRMAPGSPTAGLLLVVGLAVVFSLTGYTAMTWALWRARNRS